nr:hypothetical protein [Candidatus Nitrospira nitrificans]
MENAVHDDVTRLDLVEDGVREPSNERPTHGLIDEHKRLRMTLDGCDTRVDSRKEGGGTIGRLPVIPEVSFVEIKLRLGREAKSLHLRRRSLARICVHDLAADGFRAWARRRRSSSLR